MRSCSLVHLVTYRCRKVTEVADTESLTCREHVNETAYDFLEGVAMRQRHKAYPEPEVAMIFKKEPTDNSIDLTEVESSLQKAIKQVSCIKVTLYTIFVLRAPTPLEFTIKLGITGE